MMRCPHCSEVIPAELGFENLTASAAKLEGKRNDFLTRTPRGNLLRVRVLYTMSDAESGEDCFKVQVAPAADESGDVLKGLRGENVIYPAIPVSVKSARLQHDSNGRPVLSLTGQLAEVVAQAVLDGEQRLYAQQHLVALFGTPVDG